MEVSQHPCLPKEFALSAHYYWHTVCSDFYDFGIFTATTALFMGFYFFIALVLLLINIAIGGCMPSMMGRVQG